LGPRTFPLDTCSPPFPPPRFQCFCLFSSCPLYYFLAFPLSAVPRPILIVGCKNLGLLDFCFLLLIKFPFPRTDYYPHGSKTPKSPPLYPPSPWLLLVPFFLFSTFQGPFNYVFRSGKFANITQVHPPPPNDPGEHNSLYPAALLFDSVVTLPFPILSPWAFCALVDSVTKHVGLNPLFPHSVNPPSVGIFLSRFEKKLPLTPPLFLIPLLTHYRQFGFF